MTHKVSRRDLAVSGAVILATGCGGRVLPALGPSGQPPTKIKNEMFDVIIIGGSYAGLSAALQLGRARRTVLVVDAGQRRNRFVSAAHGFLGNDGASPEAIVAKGKAEVLAYPTVSWRVGTVTELQATARGFVVRAAGDELRARRLILATGVVDERPPIPGLADLWGRGVFHCPYCDGYELQRPALGVLATNPVSVQYVQLLTEWAAPGGTTFFLNGALEPTAEQLELLAKRRITVVREKVTEVKGRPGGVSVVTADGHSFDVAALFTMPNGRLPGGFAEQLKCQVETAPTGMFFKTDAMKETTVPGVFACGDAAAPHGAIAFAVADGVRAGFSAHQSLVFRPEFVEATAPSE
jgi:thioredoxin reductase